MSTLPPRTPPRFVPTLTEVVHEHGSPSPNVEPPVVPPAMPSVAAPTPPVSFGTASPLVAPRAIGIPATRTVAAQQPRATPAPQALPDGFEEHMVHRVMQRVDVMLEKRLREAIALVVQEQTRSVLPRLREEIESVVRHSVYEAVAEELAGGQQPAGRT